tara:strand:- start:483 stop:1175 length:693 start_codon:yes stop_codon:yes gene_type:complete
MKSVLENTHIFIQARSNSSRLPGKALLKIKKLSIVELCYLRASKDFKNIKVLTSIEKSDDLLCKELRSANIPYYRGSLNNVLERFYKATLDLPDESIIVRLTADNIFPDSDFIKKVIYQFLEKDFVYMNSSTPKSKLPYGLSVEVFTMKSLKSAFQNASSAFDLEHVTPYIRREIQDSHYLDKDNTDDLSNFRCTIDTQEDYERMIKVFSNVKNPITEPVSSLIKLLREV